MFKIELNEKEIEYLRFDRRESPSALAVG